MNKGMEVGQSIGVTAFEKLSTTSPLPSSPIPLAERETGASGKDEFFDTSRQRMQCHNRVAVEDFLR